ncbi:hypothetical protein LWE61_09830 [Sphingobium sufflavum]|nr:hypothetical protein [Sphingobium sufflavum]MCE7796856.1 hypothetical protein [Sphingobium sufflavum]
MDGVRKPAAAPMRRSHHVHYSAASRRNLWWRVADDAPVSPRLRVNQSEG